MGRLCFHSTEAVWERIARKEWLGVDMMSPMLYIPGSTPVWAQFILFFGFSYYKIYMYYVLKSIYIQYKTKTLVVSDLVWPDEVQRTFSTAHWFLKQSNYHRQYLRVLKIELLYLYYFYGT